MDSVKKGGEKKGEPPTHSPVHTHSPLSSHPPQSDVVGCSEGAEEKVEESVGKPTKHKSFLFILLLGATYGLMWVEVLAQTLPE